MEFHINQTILNRILNDDIESELKQIIHNELSKPYSEINADTIDDCIKAIESIK